MLLLLDILSDLLIDLGSDFVQLNVKLGSLLKTLLVSVPGSKPLSLLHESLDLNQSLIVAKRPLAEVN